MKNLSEWPALSPVSAWPEVLEYSRAVWGKVHGASSDYRWIALSAGFVPETDLQKEFVVGVEDLPESTLLWRNPGGRCHAVRCYPSRATDAAGREKFLEKQVLSWDRGDLPAALGALVLLSRAADLNDSIWWNRYEGQSWSDPGFALTIEDQKPFPVQQEELAGALEQGLAEIRSALGIERLQALYAAILAGSKPAFLTGLQKPLSAAALAALLLPLPREHADRLSLAGWLPSRRASLEELKALWDVVVLPPGLPELASNAAEIDPRLQAEGLRLAKALFGQPSVSDPLADLPPKPFEALQEPAPTPRKPAPSGRPIPGHTTELASPAPGMPDALKQLHAFAVATDRRWIEPEALDKDTFRPGRFYPGDSPIPGWIRTLDEQRPSWADEEQWAVKLDLLRCAALVFHPHPSSDLPKTGRVPALYFATSLSTTNLDLLGNIGQTKLKQVLEQSLSLGRNQRTRKMKELAERWRNQTDRRDMDIERMIRDALAATKA